MKTSLRSRLSFSYAVMALLLVALISLLINMFFNDLFKDYVISQQNQRNQEIVNLLEKQYSVSGAGGSWNVDAIESIGLNALEQGIIVQVKDESGNTIWDATVHNNGLCAQMLSQMANNMHNQYPNFKGGYQQDEYKLTSDSAQVGVVEIGYYGPYYYTNNDIQFLNSINTILLAVGAASLVLAFLLGAFMSSRISRPISKTIQAAAAISKGNFRQRIEEKSKTKEIKELTETVNHLADSLEKQEALRKRTAADVAHELRTPLANLQSSLEAMIDGIWEPSAPRLESCHEEILRINRLVGDLEKLERFEAENVALDYSDFDITEMITHILHNFETEYYKKGVALRFDGENVVIRADKDKISQVVINLVSNALKYTPEGGSVEVAVKEGKEEKENTVEITVSDSGNGIPAEDIPFIFERFYRADKSRNRLTGGSGLGLTIAKAIVDSHRGEIGVSSETGKGTVFTVSLPKAGGLRRGQRDNDAGQR